MSYNAKVKLSSKGQLTLPARLRQLWALKTGDTVDIQYAKSGEAILTKPRMRSILESRKDLLPLSLGRPLTQKDIDDAIGQEMIEQERRIRKQWKRR